MGGDSDRSTHSAAACVSPVQSSQISCKRKNSTSSQDNKDAPESPAQAVAKRAKSVDEIDEEVRELLDKKLFGQDDAVKVEAMRKLTEYFRKGGNTDQEYQQKAGHRRAAGEWGACRLVLLVLDLELDKGDRANRQIVYSAVRFLQHWNLCSAEHRDTMLRFKGVEFVAKAMQAFPDDSYSQYVGISCLLNFTKGTDKKHRGELVEANCIPILVRIMMAHANAEETRKYALIALGRLCEVAGSGCFEGHVDASAFGFLLQMFQAYKDSDDRFAGEVRKSCRALTSKMLE
jgi:hypothetical protein